MSVTRSRWIEVTWPQAMQQVTTYLVYAHYVCQERQGFDLSGNKVDKDLFVEGRIHPANKAVINFLSVLV